MVVALLKVQDFPRAIQASSRTLESHYSRNIVAKNTIGSLDECMLLSEVQEETMGITDTTFIYKNGILLHPKVTEPNIITTILIFNTALAHHLCAIEKQQHQMLLKAKRLYELAYSVHDMDHDPLFQFAVINNIAMIEQMLGNTAVSDDCMDYLVSLFMLLLDQGFHTHFHHVRGFVANLPSNSNFAVAA